MLPSAQLLRSRQGGTARARALLRACQRCWEEIGADAQVAVDHAICSLPSALVALLLLVVLHKKPSQCMPSNIQDMPANPAYSQPAKPSMGAVVLAEQAYTQLQQEKASADEQLLTLQQQLAAQQAAAAVQQQQQQGEVAELKRRLREQAIKYSETEAELNARADELESGETGQEGLNGTWLAVGWCVRRWSPLVVCLWCAAFPARCNVTGQSCSLLIHG